MDANIRVAVIEQVGYREWTESLGSDREWLIQVTQSRVYRAGQEAATEVGGFLLSLRYDIMLLLASNLSEGDVRFVHDSVAKVASVKVRTASSCASTPLEAVDRAWRMLTSLSPGEVEYEPCLGPEAVAVAHIDIDGITRLTRELGPLKTYYMVLNMIYRVKGEAEKLGAIIQYLGGDNLLAVLPLSRDPIEATSRIVEGEGLKAGVGVAMKARESLALAAEALHRIRAGIVGDRVLVLSESHVKGMNL